MNRKQIDLIENAVTVPSVLAMHGVTTNATRCRCPVHHGRRYSFSFNDRLFHCFTCGASGGVIQLEAALDGTDLDTACHVLAKQYGIEIDEPLSKREIQDLKLTRLVEQDYSEWKKEQAGYYRRLTNVFRNIVNVPELSDMAHDLEQWLDENMEGVIQPWKYQPLN